MPIVQVTLVEGRDEETRAALIRELTDAVERTTGSPRDRVRVILHQVPAADWGVGGAVKQELG
jgi:4-oxalocrotonate tautomerase